MEKHQISQSRWWDWAAVGLHFVLLQTVATRLAATSWTPFLYLIQTFTYMGFVIGTALGYSTFQRRTVRLLTFFYMIILLPLQWTLVIDQNASLEEQLASVAGRLFFSTSDFFAQRPVEDPLFFVALMSIAFWIISSWAGFTLVRSQNYLGAVLPASIGLIIIHNYDSSIASRLWFLAFFAFLALLLLGRLQFLENKQSWRERRIFVSPDTSLDLTSSMAVAAGLIILVSWTVPASLSSLDSAVRAWSRVSQPWRAFTERMENAVSALESPSGGRRGEFFGRFSVDTMDSVSFPREGSQAVLEWRASRRLELLHALPAEHEVRVTVDEARDSGVAAEVDHARVAQPLAKQLAQVLVHLAVEAVEPVGTVERDPDDRPVLLEDDGFVIAHALSPSPLAMRRRPMRGQEEGR